jgi:hypothetical protein
MNEKSLTKFKTIFENTDLIGINSTGDFTHGKQRISSVTISSPKIIINVLNIIIIIKIIAIREMNIEKTKIVFL